MNFELTAVRLSKLVQQIASTLTLLMEQHGDTLSGDLLLRIQFVSSGNTALMLASAPVTFGQPHIPHLLLQMPEELDDQLQSLVPLMKQYNELVVIWNNHVKRADGQDRS